MTSAALDPERNAIVQLTPGSSSQAIVQAIDMGRVAVVDPGLAAVQFEFVGPSVAPGLRAWLREDFDAIVPPPWETRT